MTDNVVSLEDKIIDEHVQVLWEGVVQTLNKVIHHANIYGFELMTIPDPDVHKISQALDNVVLPTLEIIIKGTEFSPESGLKMDNIKQYALHLREIRYAIDNNVKEDFDRIIALLESSPMIV